MRRAGVWLAVVGVAATLAGPLAGSAVAGPAAFKQGTYVGAENFSGPPKAKVRLELRESARGKARGTFTAKDVLPYCDDGTRPIRTLPPINVSPGGGGMVGSKYVFMVDGFQSYYRVELRFARNGAVARGSIIYLETPIDAAGGPQRADCSVGVPVHWTARRVQG